jgi:cytochrome c oxidase subunit III
VAGPGQAHGERRVALVSVGMILFLGSELMFFAALFAAYFTMRAGAAAWPPKGTELDLLQPAVFTAILVLSSGTMQLAVARIRQDDRAGARRWLWVTVGLGALFLFGQYLDYRGRNFGISTNAYGSAFYTMTGFHALHVLAGLALLLVAQARVGTYSAGEHGGLEAVGYYWHFVDVVWLALFAAIFLVR